MRDSGESCHGVSPAYETAPKRQKSQNASEPFLAGDDDQIGSLSGAGPLLDVIEQFLEQNLLAMVILAHVKIG